jgi:hypothetical protein
MRYTKRSKVGEIPELRLTAYQKLAEPCSVEVVFDDMVAGLLYL